MRSSRTSCATPVNRRPDGGIGVLGAAEWIAASTAGVAPTPGAVLLTATDEVEPLASHLERLRWIVD